jgi:1-phosphofructokinase family hexose kinase
MILTLTLNPAVDQTLWVPELAVGEVNRPHDSQLDPAGKGINVSRMAHRLGWPTLAFGFVAGDIGHIMERALDEERVHNHLVRIPGQTRINTTIVDEKSGSATSLYGPGPPVQHADVLELDRTLTFWLQAGRILVVAGTLLPGTAEDYYADLITRARAAGVKTILDSDGEAQRRAVTARPYLIKPNREEASRLLGRPLPDLPSVVAGAHEIRARYGVEVVILSLGKEGAVCVTGDRALRAIPPEVERRSTVGSGDSLVAGIAVALARGEDLEQGLRLGTAAGAATAMSSGTALGTPADIAILLPRVQIEDIA